MSTITIATVLRSDATRQMVQAAIAGIACNDQLIARPVNAGELNPAMLKAAQADLILVELRKDDAAELQLLADCAAGGAAAPVLVTAPDLDARTTRELLHAGVADVLPQPFSGTELWAAALNALHRTPMASVGEERGRGSVVAFLKGSGGVGATSLAVQGACALSKRRGAPAACLLDLDIQFGSAGLIMDVEPRSSLVELARDPRRIDGALLRGSMVRPADGGFDLLAAPPRIPSLDEVTAQGVAAAIATARREYGRVLLDLPLLWTDWVHTALSMADLIVLVLEPTVPAVRKARLQLDTLAQEELDGIPLLVVANKQDTGWFGGKGVALHQAEKALGRKIDFTVPRDGAMRLAADVGRPLSAVHGGKALQRKIGSMMDSIFAATGATRPVRSA